MNPEPPDYITYLLRVWCAGSTDDAGWRAALEDPRSGERQAFRDLAALFAFLDEKTRGPSQRAEGAPVENREDAARAPDAARH